MSMGLFGLILGLPIGLFWSNAVLIADVYVSGHSQFCSSSLFPHLFMLNLNISIRFACRPFPSGPLYPMNVSPCDFEDLTTLRTFE